MLAIIRPQLPQRHTLASACYFRLQRAWGEVRSDPFIAGPALLLASLRFLALHSVFTSLVVFVANAQEVKNPLQPCDVMHFVVRTHAHTHASSVLSTAVALPGPINHGWLGTPKPPPNGRYRIF